MHYHPLPQHRYTTSTISPFHYHRNMSHSQSPPQSSFGDQPGNVASSTPSRISPVRLGTAQGTRLPPISSFFGSDASKTLIPSMDVDSSSKVVRSVPSHIREIASKSLPSFQVQRRPILPRTGSPMPPDHRFLPSLLGALTGAGQKNALPHTSCPPNPLDSCRSPRKRSQRVGSTIKGAIEAQSRDTFHIAATEDDQMVVNMAAITPTPAENELIPWEPGKPPQAESLPLPLLDGKDRGNDGYQPFEGKVLGKRSNPFSGRKAKKGKPGEGCDLAASLDALAREHARSNLSSSTVSIPCSDSRRTGPQASELYHDENASQATGTRDCEGNDQSLNEPKPENSERQAHARVEREKKKAAEHGNGLDFLATVVLAQNNYSTGEFQMRSSGSQEVTNATNPNRTDGVSSTVPVRSTAYTDQNPQMRNERENEPTSEASCVLDEKISNPVSSQEVTQENFSPEIANNGHQNRRNSVIDEAEAVESPRRASKIPRNAQYSSPRIFSMGTASANIGTIGHDIPKCSKSYKLKRGPKSKRQKLDRVTTSNTGKPKGRGESPHEKRNQGESAFKSHTDPMVAKGRFTLAKHRSFARTNKDDVQPQRPLQFFHSSRSHPSSRVPKASPEGTSLNCFPSSETAPTNTRGQRNTLTRERKILLDHEKLTPVENCHHENEKHCHREGKTTTRDQESPSSSFSVGAAHRQTTKSKTLKADQGNEGEDKLHMQLRSEVPSSAASAALASIPMELITAAAKQSPPYVHKCDQCGSVFNRRFNLNKHIRNVHENIRKFICTTCGELFLQKSHLAAHVLAVHDKSRPFQCEFCPKSFSWVGVLRKHMQAIHKVTLQKRVQKSDRPSILKAPNEKSETIDGFHPHDDGRDRYRVLSCPKRKIEPSGTGVVATPHKSTSTSVKPQ